MKLVIERELMFSALSHVMGAVESRSTIPVLANVLLKAENGRLHLTGTNLDHEVSASVDAKVEGAGLITAPARELLDIARRAPAGSEIAITHDAAADTRMKVRAGRSNFVLPTLPGADFPIMAGVKNGTSFEVSGKDLSRLIDRTRHAMSVEETRYYLNGVYLHAINDGGDEVLRMVATDGNRLALAEMSTPEGAAGMKGVIVPRKALALIRQIIDGAAVVQVASCEAKISVRCGDTTLTTKVIDGSFPDYGRVIPRGEGEYQARLKGSDLARGIDSANIVGTEKVNILRFAFRADGLKLSSRNEYGGQADTEVEATFTGADFDAGFNARYAHDLASLVGDVEITCDLWGASSPMRVQLANDPTATFILMPARV